MQTQPTYIQFRQITIAELQSEVQQLLKWDAAQYSHFIYQTGMEYLHQYFKEDKAAVALLETRAEFWNWFKNQWAMRDVSFLTTEGIELVSHATVKNIYYALHQPEELVKDIVPNRTVLGAQFHHVKTPAAV